MSAWDWAISSSIIGALILTIWAKVSGQTIPELIGGIKEALSDTTEDSTEAMVSYE